MKSALVRRWGWSGNQAAVNPVALGVMQDLGVNGRIVAGSIKFKGQDLGAMSEEELRQIRRV